MIITPEQIRAARALLRLEQEEVARLAQVSVVTIRRLEASHGSERVTPETLDGVRQVLERAGAEFIADGVRRRRTVQEREALLAQLRKLSAQSAARLRDGERMQDTDLHDEHGLPA